MAATPMNAVAEWPEGSESYNPLTMSSRKYSRLLTNDTAYCGPQWPWYMVCNYVNDGQVCTYSNLRPEDAHAGALLDPRILESRMTVLHIRQKRRYFSGSTVSDLSLDEATWKSLLRQFKILPSFLELLHSNNGGAMSYTTYAPAPESGLDCEVAIHVGYKMGDWGNDESAIYGRLDLVTNCSVVLVLGTDACLGVNEMRHLLHSRPEASILHVLHTLHTNLYNMTEEIRWGVDGTTQRLESLTGYAALQQYFIQPVEPRELRHRRDLYMASDFCRNLVRGSERVRLNMESFLAHLALFEGLMNRRPDPSKARTSTAQIQNIRESCQMNIELARSQHDQSKQLYARLLSQIEVTKTLMAQRDTHINIAIAEATKRDSELMRGIAAVTMVFLQQHSSRLSSVWSSSMLATRRLYI